MRDHEPWCASRYKQEGVPPAPCDCGSEREQAQPLAPFNPLDKSKRRKRGRVAWRGNLPAQFCVKCEGSMTKRIDIVPHDPAQPPRVMAACLDPECAHLRELQPPA